MRLSSQSLAGLALVLALPIADAYQPLDTPSLPFQTPVYSRLRSKTPGAITKLRDSLIHLIWGPPPTAKDSAGSCLGTSRDVLPAAAAPQSLLARYGGDVVLRFSINSTEEAQALADATETLFLDVWEHTQEWADIRLSKDLVPSLLELLPPSLQHAHTPLMYNLAQAIHESFPSPAFADPDTTPRDHARSFTPSLSPKAQQNNVFFSDYQPLSVIHPWMRLLQSLFPTHVRLISLGTSYEGRDILALRVGVHPTNAERPSGPRKTVLVTGGLHAREWISTSSVSYAAYRLVTAYGKDQALTKLIEEFDFVFVPTLNPDGYVYSWETDRLWRKNRQDTNLRFCRGLDLDRSFTYQWDGASTAGNPCSEGYAGEEPLEALETRRLTEWLRSETESGRAQVVGFLDLHSYSQQVLYPFAYSCIATPPTLENLEEVGLGLAKAIRLADGVAYDVTSACEGSVLAKTAARHRVRIESLGGSALDYMYHEGGVRHAYQIKLRDRGSYGFLLPAKHIVPVGKEVFGAVEFLGKFLLGDKGIERGMRSGAAEEAVETQEIEEADEEHERDMYDGSVEL